MARGMWLVVLLSLATSAVSAEPAGTVVLHRQGRSVPIRAETGVLGKLGLKLLESSNFNTAAHHRILSQSVPQIQERYRRVVAGDHLVIRYEQPLKVSTVGGEVSVFDIVIGLGRPDHADALFTIDDQGRVVEHGKYSGAVAVELRRAVDAAAGGR